MKKKKGFSLIEVVLAMAVLAIAVLPILSMYPSALRMSTRANEVEEWSRVTQTIVDYIKSRGYDEVASFTYNLTTGELSETYEFEKIAGSDTYIDKDHKFEQLLYKSNKGLFLISTKGINLSKYKFRVEMKKLKPSDGITTLLGSMNNLDLDNYIVSNGVGKEFIHGVVKIREKGKSFDEEDKRDLNFIITPIENWR